MADAYIKKKIIFLPFIYIHMTIFASSDVPLVQASTTGVGLVCGRSAW